MKKINILIMAILASAPALSAKGIAPVGVDSIAYDRHGDYMVLNMNLDLRPTEVESSRAQILTPFIVSENGDSVALPSVGVYGRQRYFYYLRNGQGAISGDRETAFRDSDRPASLAYEASAPYAPWMDRSRLVVRRSLYGCCNALIEQRTNTVTEHFVHNPAIPEIVFVPAKDTVPKTDTIKGSAFIDFRVDKTNIDPSYRENERELARIQHTIDTVYKDNDVIVTSVWLKGFASPESPYAHNTDLAIGRTAALKEHINQLYNFRDGIISTDYEPEDWEGLRRFVTASNINHREEILQIIDSDMEPDPKEDLIRRKFPKEYTFMRENFYPALRHTDYRIVYEIKRFTDIDKIRQVLRDQPSRLSLEELFILGNAAVPGSDEFNNVYETAVRMFPSNETAIINAANAALQRGDLLTAEKYLSRAGDSQSANYVRGALAFLQADYDKAETLMKQASSIPQAEDVIVEIQRIRNNSKQKVTKLTLN